MAKRTRKRPAILQLNKRMLKGGLLLVLLSISSCWLICRSDLRLKIHNQSGRPVYVAFGVDTLHPEVPARIGFMLSSYRIEPDSVIKLAASGGATAWEGRIFRSRNRQLHIFILSEDTLNKYDFHDVVRKRNFLKVISLTKEELIANQWTVLYK